MRINALILNNFGSYAYHYSRLADTSLCLIHGATGSGKSTLGDAIVWCLYGKSTKGGSIDDIRRWGVDNSVPTSVELVVAVKNKTLSITRTRSNKKSDLYYSVGFSGNIRGKDIADTQRLLNGELGVDLAGYLAAAHFHEFSETSQFFVTNAKNRRIICEQLVDLTFPKELADTTAIYAKELDDDGKRLTNELYSLQSKLSEVTAFLNEEQQYTAAQVEERALEYANFEKSREAGVEKISIDIGRISDLRKTSVVATLGFQNQLAALQEDVCTECGSAKRNISRDSLLASIDEGRKYVEHLDHELTEDSKYLKFIQSEKNPYIPETVDSSRSAKFESRKVELATKLQVIQDKLTDVAVKRTDAEQLLSAVSQLRMHLIDTTISRIQDRTNSLIATYFDFELQVSFVVEGADKIEAVISKDGNECAYTQLSKGQRQLLKLCFGVAVMEQVSNRSGIHFQTMFFDEALDGLSEELKIKSVGLFEELASAERSVLVVEHSNAIAPLFNQTIHLALLNGFSEELG